jgi:hypothetical protein
MSANCLNNCKLHDVRTTCAIVHVKYRTSILLITLWLLLLSKTHRVIMLLAEKSIQFNRYPDGPCAGIFNQSMGARNRVGIGLSYRLARLHTQPGESVP